MLTIISPTGLGLRETDDFGSGLFHAPRGTRLHNGVDYVCVPNQDVVSPIYGKLQRVAYPYATDLRWRGVLIENKDISVTMFYLRPTMSLIKLYVRQGDVVGVAQNIASKYNTPNKKMTPHIHLGINWINPDVIRRKS